MQNLSRREREKQNRRNEILQAAWKVFSSRNYDAATIDEVAALAELSKGTVYLYFQSKADLFFSTLEMGIDKTNLIIQDVISCNDDHLSGVREIIKRLMDYAEENKDFFKILSTGRSHFELHAEMANKLDFKKRLKEAEFCTFAMLVEYIQRGIQMGVFRKVNPEDAALVLLTVIRGIAIRRIIDPGVASLPEKAESITDILLEGIMERDLAETKGNRK